MSTILYSRKHGKVVADTRAWAGRGTPSPGSKAKTRKLEDGTVIGVTSAIVGAGEVVMDWYSRGMPADQRKDLPEGFELMVVKPNGDLFIGDGDGFLSGPIDAERHAMGSGGDFAIAALAAGADPIQAVEIACAMDPFSGPPIRVIATGEAQS